MLLLYKPHRLLSEPPPPYFIRTTQKGMHKVQSQVGSALNIQPLSIPAHPFLPEPIFALSVSSLSSLSFHSYRARVLKHALQRRREGLNSPFRYYPVMWEYNVSRFKGKNSDHLRHPSVVAIPLFVQRQVGKA